MKDYIALIKKAGQDFMDDDCLSSGAAIAYYTIFSLPPLLTIIFMFTTALGFSEHQVGDLLRQELGLPLVESQEGASGPSDSSSSSTTSTASDPGADLPLGLGNLGIISKLVGLCVLLVSATAIFGQLQYSLDKAWEVKPDPHQGGVWRFATKRLLSVGVVLVIGFLMLVSLVLTTLLDQVLKWIWHASPEGIAMGFVLNELLSLSITALLFAAMFKILPDAKIAWRDVWAGAICSAILFEVGKFLISWYLQHSGLGGSWGASAVSVIGALVWVYYSSLIVLFGAEFTQAWARQFGTAPEPEEGAVRVVTEERTIPQLTGVEVPH
jgi:membrane protein